MYRILSFVFTLSDLCTKEHLVHAIRFLITDLWFSNEITGLGLHQTLNALSRLDFKTKIEKKYKNSFFKR